MVRENRLLPLITRDPVTGSELIATRLESPSGLIVEGRFSLGWMGRLSSEQLNFVGLLLRRRNNLQKVASDMGVAYNTAKARLDDIVEALEPPDPAPIVNAVLDSLEAGEMSIDEAMKRLELGGD